MDTVAIKQETIKTNRGTLAATIYGDIDNASSTLVIAAATGVKQYYYKNFASFIAENEISVITFDYTGIDGSLTQKIQETSTNVSDWGAIDLEAIIGYAKTRQPNSKLNIMGHSIGGQLIGMAKSAVDADKVVLVASQSGYWKYWRGRHRIVMWLHWHVLFPSLCKICGYLPAKLLSSMENLPKNMVLQWCRWAKHKDYFFSELDCNTSYYGRMQMPMTVYSIDDDHDMAPKEAVDWLAEQYYNTDPKRIHLVPTYFGLTSIGHFGIFQKKLKEPLWHVLLGELV